MSPSYATGGYPNSQLCTWRFLVQESTPRNKQVLIKFPEFNLQKGKDGDVVKIYSGWNEKAPLLAEFSGDRPPPAKGVASNSPIVFLVFRSDSRGKSKGFRGLFINQREWQGFVLCGIGRTYCVSFFVRAVVTSGGSRGGAGPPSGVPNDDFLQNLLKSLFRLSRVRLDL